jgi:hypothetical protein
MPKNTSKSYKFHEVFFAKCHGHGNISHQHCRSQIVGEYRGEDGGDRSHGDMSGQGLSRPSLKVGYSSIRGGFDIVMSNSNDQMGVAS